jgi:acyl-CoA dehydrogenase
MKFTPDQELMRAEIRKFVAKELPPGFARQCDREQKAPMAQYRRLAEAGWLGLGIPEEHGGAGGGIVELTILLEELAKGMMSFSIMAYRSAVHGAQSLLSYGSDEQRRRYLPGIISGDLLFCLSLTEPEAGSDAANLKIRAVRDGDDFVITGQKLYNSGAHIANYIVLAARTNPTAPRHKGISLFIVDTRSPGLTIQRIETMGERAVGTNAVFYDGVRVPAANLLGQLDNGWTHLAANLEKERLCLAAWCIGSAETVLEQSIAYAKQRVQFGKPIGSFQAIQHKIADMAMQIHIGKLMMYDLAEKIEAGIPCRMEASMTKAYCTEACNSIAFEGLQIHGGFGYTMDSDMQLIMRDARIMSIGGGASEIMRNMIARELGLPKG